MDPQLIFLDAPASDTHGLFPLHHMACDFWNILRDSPALPAGQSINVHVYPSKPEGVFVPEGATEMPAQS